MRQSHFEFCIGQDLTHSVQHSGQVQLAIGTFDLCHIAQVFDVWHHGSEIPLHQIVTLWVTMIALCQAMRTFFAL